MTLARRNKPYTMYLPLTPTKDGVTWELEYQNQTIGITIIIKPKPNQVTRTPQQEEGITSALLSKLEFMHYTWKVFIRSSESGRVRWSKKIHFVRVSISSLRIAEKQALQLNSLVLSCCWKLLTSHNSHGFTFNSHYSTFTSTTGAIGFTCTFPIATLHCSTFPILLIEVLS